MPAYVPVVVIGAGPTGTTAANLLGRYGIGCLVLERRADVYPLPRAVHFDDEVFRIFADLGLGERVASISRPTPGMRLTDRDHRVLAQVTRDPARQEHGYPQANMFDQPDLERVLRAALERYPHVELRSGVEVVDIQQVDGGPAPVLVRYRSMASTGGAAAETLEVWTDVLLGCDGANSNTRAVVGAGMQRLCGEQHWLVVDVDCPGLVPAYNGVQQVCHYEQAATFMPVVGHRYRWEFRLRGHMDPSSLDDAHVRDLIRPWLAGVDPDTVRLVRGATYTFRGAVADRWQRGRVLLLGDAAHLTPPFIGQGMCAGIRDAANLAWKAVLVVNGTADERILATYEQERRPYAKRVVQLAVMIGWLMTGGTARTARLRRALLRAVTLVPGIEDRALETTWPAFSTGPLVQRRGRRSPAGRLLPQPRVRTADGRMLRLDSVLGDGFAVVYRGPDAATSYEPELREWFDRLGATFVRIGADIDDIDGVLTRLLDAARSDALLLRPDRVIAADAAHLDLRAWRHLLTSAGISPSAERIAVPISTPMEVSAS